MLVSLLTAEPGMDARYTAIERRMHLGEMS
jgi:hypothetical protein